VVIVEKTCRTCGIVSILSLILALGGCQGLPSGIPAKPPTPANPAVSQINHIVVLTQENRSFDSYFGHLPQYWAANGYPMQQFDGTPSDAWNPSFSGTSEVSAFHTATECVDNLSPSWNESHLDWNLQQPLSSSAKLDGFLWNAANFAMNENQKGASPQFTDTAGIRAMGYYDGSDLNYYYFMASNFATSDRWFSPVLSRTQVNRLYLFAATSQGYAFPPGTDAADNAPINTPTIFDNLTAAGVSWKIYYTDDVCSTTPPEIQGANGAHAATGSGPCTYLTQFANYAPPNTLPSNLVPISQYFTDVQAGTLPSVAFIETGYLTDRDEHPSPLTNIQTGAAYSASLINALMASPSWKDSAFILTFDEGGGFYDHVPPQPAVNPDDVPPIDLQKGDQCYQDTKANCDFNYTGYRVPLIVISPFSKKNYVSHTVADYTAVLKLIEARFQVPSLTKRDAAQMDMTEFFDFQNVPWSSPPSPPAQATNGACNSAVLQ
jgi:phospholipase C